jgi:phosphoserine phosphatase RsbU/P
MRDEGVLKPVEPLKLQVPDGWGNPARSAEGSFVHYAASVEVAERGTVRISLRVPLNYFEERISRKGFSESRYPVLMARDGTYIAHFEIGVADSGQSIYERAVAVKRPQLKDVGDEVLSGRTGMIPMRGVITDEDVWVIYTPMKSTGWALLVAIPNDQMMAPVYSHVLQQTTVMGLGLAAILGIIFFVSRRITGPVESLVQQVQALRPGQIITPNLRCGPREIHQLSKAFASMSSNLADSLQREQVEITRREAVRSELTVARNIQESLLPAPLAADQLAYFGIDLFAANYPAREIAGDFFDHFVDARGRLVMVVADVCGKGAAASLLMAVTRTAIRGCADACDSPGEMLRTVNRVLYEPARARPMFVTLIILVAEPGS